MKDALAAIQKKGTPQLKSMRANSSTTPLSLGVEKQHKKLDIMVNGSSDLVSADEMQILLRKVPSRYHAEEWMLGYRFVRLLPHSACTDPDAFNDDH